MVKKTGRIGADKTLLGWYIHLDAFAIVQMAFFSGR